MSSEAGEAQGLLWAEEAYLKKDDLVSDGSKEQWGQTGLTSA
jgi:hypothetical protein